MVFEEYAKYYDLLYKDKNYSAEVEYIHKLIQKYHENAGSILDLGCGTGKHAELLIDKGYTVHGIDMSEDMLKEAIKRGNKNKKLTFTLSDIQNFELGKNFDIVTALFHVMSYQNSNERVEKVLKNVYSHLNDNGIFIFDCWYGPAVLSEQPEVRIKRLENDEISIIRIAEPIMRENENIVEVHYDVFIEDKSTKKIKELKETHIMRYFFIKEIEQLIHSYGFTLIDKFEFLTGNSLNKSTWGSCFVVKK